MGRAVPRHFLNGLTLSSEQIEMLEEDCVDFSSALLLLLASAVALGDRSSVDEAVGDAPAAPPPLLTTLSVFAILLPIVEPFAQVLELSFLVVEWHWHNAY